MLAAAIPAATAAIGELDVLVHNAGVFFPGPVADSTVDHWRVTLDVNVVGAVALTLALLPALRRAGGQVVCINSGTGRKASPEMASYSASKFAQRAFADSLRASEPALHRSHQRDDVPLAGARRSWPLRGFPPTPGVFAAEQALALIGAEPALSA